MRPPVLAALLVLVGCDALPPAPPTRDRRAVAAHETARDASAPPDLQPAALVEVEIRGRVTLPAEGAPAGRPLVVVTDGPCFEAGTHYLGTARPDPAHPYLIEIFPPSGTRLEVCAALPVPGGGPTVWWGRAPRSPLRAEGRGEVRLAPVDVSIARAAPVTLPAGL